MQEVPACCRGRGPAPKLLFLLRRRVSQVWDERIVHGKPCTCSRILLSPRGSVRKAHEGRQLSPCRDGPRGWAWFHPCSCQTACTQFCRWDSNLITDRGLTELNTTSLYILLIVWQLLTLNLVFGELHQPLHTIEQPSENTSCKATDSDGWETRNRKEGNHFNSIDQSVLVN